MWTKWFAGSTWHRRIATKGMDSPDHESVYDRHERLDGYHQGRLRTLSLLMVGAGGIGSEIGYTAVRKGIGALCFLDPDVVEPSNLSRQFFHRRDIFKRKAPCLVRNLAAHATGRMVLEGHACRAETAIERGLTGAPDVVVCGVDNNPARVAVARFCLERRIPVIFIAVDRIAENGYVFVQEPGKACFGCLFPDCLEPREAPCRTPAVIDILKVMAGIAMYALDTLLMEGRHRDWNYRNVRLAGYAPSETLWIARSVGCPLCGAANTSTGS